MATQSCQVRVGVRVRPLTSKETSEGGKSVVECNPFNHTIELGSKRKFTYDSVFHSNVDQIDLYNDVSPPLLNAFLGGYNATGESKIYSCVCMVKIFSHVSIVSFCLFSIFSLLPAVIAYGQTGSGKTYTCGSEAHGDSDINLQSNGESCLSESDGLIPR